MKNYLLAGAILGAVLMPVQAGAIQKGDAANGAKIAEQCAGCHGKDGVSTGPMFPNLGGQYADYIVKALKDYKTGKRQNPMMAPMAAGLSESDMEDVARYFSEQKGPLRKIDVAH